MISFLRVINYKGMSYNMLGPHTLGRKNEKALLSLLGRHPFSKACLQHYQTVVQTCMWIMEEPSQFAVGQTAQSLTCSIME